MNCSYSDDGFSFSPQYYHNLPKGRRYNSHVLFKNSSICVDFLQYRLSKTRSSRYGLSLTDVIYWRHEFIEGQN